MHKFGLYIHWPYCLNKCPYCDFASVKVVDDVDFLLNGYQRDIKSSPDGVISSIYFGGGTPSLMRENFFASLMSLITDKWQIEKGAEITLEANPDAINLDKMKFFKSMGVNRLSIGVQSLNDKNLKFLGRLHNVKTALKRVEEAQNVFKRVNIDLMYGLPRQRKKEWVSELNQALNLGLTHYSLYQLTIEEKTVFSHRNIKTCSEENARDLYILTDQIMNNFNCSAYEVSNYAFSGFESKHNMLYWTGKDYIGIGPSAHGRIFGKATQNSRFVAGWLKQETSYDKLTEEQLRLERILMGLRLRRKPFPIKYLNQKGVEKAVQLGWVSLQNQEILVTLQGTLMLNQLILLLV